jgi:hypothetical protein
MGDNSAARATLRVYPPGTQLIVLDIDARRPPAIWAKRSSLRSRLESWIVPSTSASASWSALGPGVSRNFTRTERWSYPGPCALSACSVNVASSMPSSSWQP